MVRKSGGGRNSKKSDDDSDHVPASSADSPVTSEDALAFIRQLQQAFRRPPKTKEEMAELQKDLAQFTATQPTAVSSAAQGDPMCRPPRTIRPADYEKARRTGSASRRNRK